MVEAAGSQVKSVLTSDDGGELAVTGDLAQLNVATVPGVYTSIDPAALPGFIQRLGGLCNEVFVGLGS